MKRISIHIAMLFTAVFTSIHPAYAANENTPITSLEIKRSYERQEMSVSEDAFNIEIPTRNVSYQYEIIGEPAINETITYDITISADDGYDFHGLKVGSCKSYFGTFSELELSEDRKTAYVTFVANPPEIKLATPIDLHWNGSTATWAPVEYATEYEVTLRYITSKGKLSGSKLATITTDQCSYDFAKYLYQNPYDYVFTVAALPDDNSCFLKGNDATLDFEESYLVTSDELGIYNGHWYLNKEGQKTYKVGSKTLTDGIYRIEGYYYCINASGSLTYGWQLLDNNYYYFDPDTGIMLTGLQEIDGKQYLLNESGKMLTGWQQYLDKTYYMTDQGDIVTGWNNIDGNYYYFFEDGHLNKSQMLLTKNSTLCTFNTSTGALVGTYNN